MYPIHLLAFLSLAWVPQQDPPAIELKVGQVGVEYIAHACFRLHAADGTRLLIDPFASRVWLGYDFPAGIEADAVLSTHPHYDHDGGEARGMDVPWSQEALVLRDPGEHSLGAWKILGLRGKHADPYGKEFGQKNTICPWRSTAYASCTLATTAR